MSDIDSTNGTMVSYGEYARLRNELASEREAKGRGYRQFTAEIARRDDEIDKLREALVKAREALNRLHAYYYSRDSYAAAAAIDAALAETPPSNPEPEPAGPVIPYDRNIPVGTVAQRYTDATGNNDYVMWTGKDWIPVFREGGIGWTDEALAILQNRVEGERK
jgi:hypothetical protein